MSDHRKPENHRRLVDMIADAMSHAIKSGLVDRRDLDADQPGAAPGSRLLI